MRHYTLGRTLLPSQTNSLYKNIISLKSAWNDSKHVHEGSTHRLTYRTFSPKALEGRSTIGSCLSSRGTVVHYRFHLPRPRTNDTISLDESLTSPYVNIWKFPKWKNLRGSVSRIMISKEEYRAHIMCITNDLFTRQHLTCITNDLYMRQHITCITNDLYMRQHIMCITNDLYMRQHISCITNTTT